MVVLGVETLVLRGNGEVEAKLVALGLAERQVGVIRVHEAQGHLVGGVVGDLERVTSTLSQLTSPYSLIRMKNTIEQEEIKSEEEVL